MNESSEAFRCRELSAVYKFVRGKPLLVADGYYRGNKHIAPVAGQAYLFSGLIAIMRATGLIAIIRAARLGEWEMAALNCAVLYLQDQTARRLLLCLEDIQGSKRRRL